MAIYSYMTAFSYMIPILTYLSIKKNNKYIIYEMNWYAIGEVKYFLGQTT